MHVAQSITRMLDTIVCPACHGRLAVSEEQPSISCTACGRHYSIQNGIPILIAERARS